jgi:uncharacterized membrane protein YdjX (TVP38/TMEM64 family)
MKKFLPLIFLLCLMVALHMLGLTKHISFAQFLQQYAMHKAAIAASFWQSSLIALAIYILVVALSVPGATFLTLTFGILFGCLWGGTLAVIGATFGAGILYIATRTALGDMLKRKASDKIAHFQAGFAKNAFNYLLFLRLTPLFPFWLVNIAPALLNVPLNTFLLATLLGVIPATFIFANVGAGLASLVEVQASNCTLNDCAFSLDLKSLVTPQILLALTGLGLLSLIPMLVQKLGSPKNV